SLIAFLTTLSLTCAFLGQFWMYASTPVDPSPIKRDAARPSIKEVCLRYGIELNPVADAIPIALILRGTKGKLAHRRLWVHCAAAGGSAISPDRVRQMAEGP